MAARLGCHLQRISEVYIEALTEVSHVLSPGGLNNTLLSQDDILEMAPARETVGECTFQGQ